MLILIRLKKRGLIMAITFAEVKAVLDEAINGWKTRTGREPNLPEAHDSPNFSFTTRQQLLDAEAFGFRLIDPAFVGNGRGIETNLVIALKNPDGVDGFGQMPRGGPFLSQDRIDIVTQWIDEGVPE
jgi:hypothetical protein